MHQEDTQYKLCNFGDSTLELNALYLHLKLASHNIKMRSKILDSLNFPLLRKSLNSK